MNIPSGPSLENNKERSCVERDIGRVTDNTDYISPNIAAWKVLVSLWPQSDTQLRLLVIDVRFYGSSL